MITVSILINGQPIFTRSAVNTTANDTGMCIYKLDTGGTIKHRRIDGAVKLAIKMLQTIKEP